MPDNLTNPAAPIILVGVGAMGIDYAAVFAALGYPYEAVGRGADSARVFQEKTGIAPHLGGLDNFLAANPDLEGRQAVVAVGVEALADSCKALIKAGVRDILLEKPGGRTGAEVTALAEYSEAHGARVLLAYNRRFYASTRKAMELVEADGGLEAMHFEFTEWSHKIGPLERPAGVKSTWFLANSTHVADLAFFIGGRPARMSAFTAGGNDWHPSATIFTGAGVTEKGVLFSYQAHWESAGRWSVELLSRKARYYLKPMEQLQRQAVGTLAIEPVEMDDRIDQDFKPGLHNQVRAWMEGSEPEAFCDIAGQAGMLRWYNDMAGYQQDGTPAAPATA